MVVDECHRATGKSEIVLALTYLRSHGVKFRVLGLSATPGSKKESIQVSRTRLTRSHTGACPGAHSGDVWSRQRSYVALFLNLCMLRSYPG